MTSALPSMTYLPGYRLYTGQQSSMTITPSYKPHYQQINQAQMQLGWHQLFYGQQATQWHTMCNTMHPMINSTHYYTKCLMLIWKAILQIWTICNNHLYPTDQCLANRTQLHDTVLHIFHNIQNDPNLKDILTYTNPEQIMTKPTQTIRHWIDSCHNHIQNQAKAAAIQAKLCTHNIHQYCPKSLGPQPTTAHKNLLRPP